MTTGTVLAFIVTGAILLMAIVGGIWLETRMPDPQQQRFEPVRQPDLANQGRGWPADKSIWPAWMSPEPAVGPRRPAATSPGHDSLDGRST